MPEEKKLTGYPSIDKPWLKYYSEEAINALLPECTIYEYLWENNKNHLDNIALNYFGMKITYGKLFENIRKAAKGFSSIGVCKGDIVTFFSINTPETIYCIYALNILGAIPNMEYVTESEKEAITSIERCKSETVVVLDALLPKLKNIAESQTVKNIVTLSVSDSMPAFTKFLYGIKMKKTSCRKGVTYCEMVNCETDFEEALYEKDIPAVIVHSGGTTGSPKGVVLTNNNLNYIAWAFKHNQNDTRRGDTWLCAIPAFHAFGLAMGIVFPLSQGMQLILIVNYTDKELVHSFVKYKPNHIIGSGAHVPSIQASKTIQKMDLSFFKTCGLGGTPLSIDKEKDLVDFLQKRNSIAKASIGYGMSETCSAISTELNRYYGKVGSAGIMLCKSNIRVVNSDTLEELPYGQSGELCFSGPGLMLEYYKSIEETETATFEDNAGVRWLHSGDLGYVDEDGFIFVTGRIKRIYSTRAEKNGTLYKLFPDYVASVIAKVSGVKDCAVVCIDDADYKSVAVAFIVLSEDTDKVTFKSTIMKYLDNVLPIHCIPKKICYVLSLPMTPIGKVDYQALEQLAQKAEEIPLN